ncbi:Arylsulfatase precursor [Rubripirellula tenax]|uniref:Arylsulfatase n=1 Tax=Rubripirellula tenax TaxID=2528015 RepID=A0A5C6E6N8_9BACT|nr:sulfatase-like hydrolase/transferase [Rubripirellula tenax]TWU44460.1 Arylsulfatase precursor [Rubripirellula tenax]
MIGKTYSRSETRQDFRQSNLRPTAPKLLTSFATLCVLLASNISLAESRLPNVVVLLSDDLGWKDISCFGGPVRTPTLDRLASEGMRFTDFYSGAAVCSPSRAVLLTGRTNLRCGIYSWINDNDQRIHLPKSEVTIAELLKAEGYATAHFGKWHLGMPTAKYPDKPTPSDHGFDYWFATANNAGPSHRNPKNFIRDGKKVGELEGYSCDLVVTEAAGWLDRRSNKEVPFFLNVWFHEPHAPLAAPDDLVQQYGEESDPAAVYSATVANTDRAIKRLLEKLHDVEEPDNTIIIYASDNGSYRSDRVGDLRGIKGSNYEGGIRVPGVFHWPGHIAAGAVTSEPAGLVDLVPTVCGLIGIQPPQVHLDGTDLSDLLTGKSEKVARDQPLFWGEPLGGPPFAIRDGRYSMVAYREGEVPKDQQAIASIKARIEATLRTKGIFETETRGSSFEAKLFEGFSDREVETLRGQFIQLNQFHESWIPAIKQSKLTRFELYDLVEDPSQKRELSVRLPQVHYRLKSKIQQLASDALQEAFDWSSSEAAPGEGEQSKAHIHRLESLFRSPFDAFLYVNRIPAKTESGETHGDLAGRILGRLANQEGRILIKLPPRMNRLAYEGFKIALESDTALHSGRCFSCHHLPDLGDLVANPPIPSLRNRSISPDQLREVMSSDAHREIRLDDEDLQRLHALLQTLTDVPDENFRDLILKATVLDTSGDSE